MSTKTINLKQLTESFNLFMNEVNVTDKKTAQLVDEFGVLSDEIDRLQAELKSKNARYSELESNLRVILEELKETKEKSIQTKKYLITIKRAGYEKQNYKYKEAFELAMTKVNSAIKAILETVKEETKTTSTVASSVGVQKINETDTGIIAKKQQELDAANSVLLKLSQALSSGNV